MVREENLTYRDPVIIGYGYRRRERTLREAGAERYWYDDTEDRPELDVMIDKMHLAFRPGDTLLVISPADLGEHRKTLPRKLADAGVKVQVRGHDAIHCTNAKLVKEWLAQGDRGRERHTQNKGGRPRKFNPTETQAEILRGWWHSEMAASAVIRRAEELLGGPVHRYWLRDRFGPRSKPDEKRLGPEK